MFCRGGYFESVASQTSEIFQIPLPPSLLLATFRQPRIERIMTYEAVTSTFQRVLNGAKIVVSTLPALFV